MSNTIPTTPDETAVGRKSSLHAAPSHRCETRDRGLRTWFGGRLRKARSLGLMAVFAACFAAAPAAAQVAGPPAAPVGLWQCTVNSSVYGLEMEMQVSPDGTLVARGMVIYHGVQNPFTQVEGYGDWSVLPPDASSDHYLFKFRMFPQAQNHPIVTWHARPTGQGIMYNLFQNPQTGHLVETQCAKFG